MRRLREKITHRKTTTVNKTKKIKMKEKFMAKNDLTLKLMVNV